MAKLSRIGKLSPITPEDAKSQSGYTISSYNKPRQMKGLTLERVAEICKQVNPNKDWTDAEIEELTDIASDPAFPTEADFIYVLKNLPKVMGARTRW
jgi:hypothetical protein